MTNFKALVILSSGTKNIEKKVAELLNPYYLELEVEPYKEYLNKEKFQAEIEYISTFSKEEIEKLAVEYEFSGENLIEDLAKINLDWYEEDIAGVDEHGEYQITTYNPQSKWDWYRFIKAEPREDEPPINYPCRVKDLPKVVPYALITPDGKWYELGFDLGIQAFMRSHSMSDTNITEKEMNWDLKVNVILACYSDFIAVALNCHI
ncbi:MAG: hypothetical protein AAF757_09600 [Cyanobacteria bacterium P01_D01_bin.116]